MFRPAFALIVVLVFTACSSSDPALTEIPAPALPPPSASIDFSDFVKGEINNTSDQREPVDVAGVEFRFEDDPDAFGGLFTDGD